MSESQTIKRDPLLTALLPNGKRVSQVQVVRIDLAPLQEAGRHLHPVPVVGYVVTGSIRFHIDGHDAQTLGPGAAFYEPEGVDILHFDNASEAEPASFIAFYLLGSATDKLIHML